MCLSMEHDESSNEAPAANSEIFAVFDGTAAGLAWSTNFLGGDHWNLIENRRKTPEPWISLAILLLKIKNFPLLEGVPLFVPALTTTTMVSLPTFSTMGGCFPLFDTESRFAYVSEFLHSFHCWFYLMPAVHVYISLSFVFFSIILELILENFQCIVVLLTTPIYRNVCNGYRDQLWYRRFAKLIRLVYEYFRSFSHSIRCIVQFIAARTNVCCNNSLVIGSILKIRTPSIRGYLSAPRHHCLRVPSLFHENFSKNLYFVCGLWK